MVRTQHDGLSDGASALGEGAWVCVDYTLDRPMTEFEDDEVVEFCEHHCGVLTLDQWVCEDCGCTFDRDPTWGDFPEEAIIEGGVSCVAYTPENPEDAGDGA